MEVVVITRNQPLEIPKFEECLKGFDRLYVIDRPSVEYPAGIPSIYNYSGDGFLAGRMRDIGALAFAGEDILFLDGDKVRVRTFGEPKEYDLSGKNDLPADLEKLIVTLRDKYGYLYN